MSNGSPARWPIRVLTEADWAAFVDVDSHAFGSTAPAELLEVEKELHEPGRSIGAYDDRTLVGIGTAYSFQLTAPGGPVPAAGVSWVGVLPTHRRRGVLTSLMQHQLHGIHDAGDEPIAVLWASEPPIYGRYGYGLASRRLSLTVPRSATALVPDAPVDTRLRLRLAPAGDWKLTAPVHDAALANRPGMFARDERWWSRAVRDLPAMRDGESELRCVVAEDDNGIRGYARYATRQNFDDNFGQGKVSVREVIGSDAAALAGLYRYLFDLDLMGTISLWNRPVDDPVMHWLSDPRRAKPTLSDALYVRLVDVDRALGARGYAADVDVVMEVADPLCPWNDGRWRLTAGADGATCTRTQDSADLTLGVRELGAAYLGGTSLVELAAAGRVTGSPDAIAAAATAFGHSPAPWCPVVF